MGKNVAADIVSILNAVRNGSANAEEFIHRMITAVSNSDFAKFLWAAHERGDVDETQMRRFFVFDGNENKTHNPSPEEPANDNERSIHEGVDQTMYTDLSDLNPEDYEIYKRRIAEFFPRDRMVRR